VPRGNEDFYFQKDTTNHPMDRFGDRLKLTIEPYGSSINVGSVFTVRASLKANGQPVPFVPIEKKSSGRFNDAQIIYFGRAIGSAVVIEDVFGDLDKLTEVEMKHVQVGVIAGDDPGVTAKAQKMAVRVVIKMRPPNTHNTRLSHYIRTATTSFTVAGSLPEGSAREDVWLIENLSRYSADGKFFKARLQRLLPGGSVQVVENMMLPRLVRSPLNYSISRNGIATESEEGGIFGVHLTHPNSTQAQLVHINQTGSRSTWISPVNPLSALATLEPQYPIWLASDRELVFTCACNMIDEPERRIPNIRPYACAIEPKTESLWVAAKVGNNPVVLRK
jgi:hypothetical protein